jgi:hypothetical protein
MQTKQLVIGTLVGGTVSSAAGYVVLGVLFPDFYTSFLNAGAATGVATGMLAYALLLALALETRRQEDL